MAALERVNQLQQQGQTDYQIADILRQEGVSPREIQEAISQSKIKSALRNNPQMTNPALNSEGPVPGQSYPEPMLMQQSIGDSRMQDPMQQAQMPYPQMQAPPTQEIQSDYQPASQQYDEVPEYAPETYDQQQGYEQGGYYSPATDIETINEVSAQVIEEKTKAIKKQVETLIKFQNNASSEIIQLNQRLTTVENTLNELQMAIIGKIGEYGKDIKNISNEMRATQDTFSKLLNPIIDSQEERPKPKTQKKESKKKSDFEDYLR